MKETADVDRKNIMVVPYGPRKAPDEQDIQTTPLLLRRPSSDAKVRNMRKIKLVEDVPLKRRC